MQQLAVSDQQAAANQPAQYTASIGGVRIGTLDEFAKEVFGHDLPPLVEGEERSFPLGLVLGVERTKTYGKKSYRLEWIGRGRVWLAAEDNKEYATKTAVLVAGQRLAATTGAYFDERTR